MKTFWQGFREALNPMWSLAWLLYGAGHLAYLLGNRWHVRGMGLVYSVVMRWSFAICERFGCASPFGGDK
jgi:hypothetical protein